MKAANPNTFSNLRDATPLSEIQDIMANIHCPKDFTCVDLGSGDLCRAMDIGMKKCVQCLDDNFSNCTFSVSFKDIHYCTCPLRVYLAKNLKI